MAARSTEHVHNVHVLTAKKFGEVKQNFLREEKYLVKGTDWNPEATEPVKRLKWKQFFLSLI